MPTNDYHFISRWRVRASITDVADVISDAEGLPRWWPAVYLDVRELEPGEPSGVGKVIELHTRGWLPYTLRWRFQVTESDYPTNLAIEASGDFNGTGRWSFLQDGDFTNVTYDWQIRAAKPLLRRFSQVDETCVLSQSPLGNDQGRESLELELARRTAPTLEQRLRVPAPPRQASPCPPSPLPVPRPLTAVSLIALRTRRERTREVPAPDADNCAPTRFWRRTLAPDRGRGQGEGRKSPKSPPRTPTPHKPRTLAPVGGDGRVRGAKAQKSPPRTATPRQPRTLAPDRGRGQGEGRKSPKSPPRTPTPHKTQNPRPRQGERAG